MNKRLNLEDFHLQLFNVLNFDDDINKKELYFRTEGHLLYYYNNYITGETRNNLIYKDETENEKKSRILSKLDNISESQQVRFFESMQNGRMSRMDIGYFIGKIELTENLNM